MYTLLTNDRTERRERERERERESLNCVHPLLYSKGPNGKLRFLHTVCVYIGTSYEVGVETTVCTYVCVYMCVHRWLCMHTVVRFIELIKKST